MRVLVAGLALLGCGQEAPPPSPPPFEAAFALHRLTARELDNSLHALLGTHLRFAAEFPPDPLVHGFDNNVSTLEITPTWLDTASRAIRRAVEDGLSEGPTFGVRFAGSELDTGSGYAVGDAWTLGGEPLQLDVVVPEDPRFALVIVAGATDVGELPVAILVDGVERGTLSIEGTAAAPVEHRVGLELSPGPHAIGIAPLNDALDLAVASVELTSSTIVRGPGWDAVMRCDPRASHAVTCADEVLSAFARRAWRRPLPDDERSALRDLFETLIDDGEPPLDALRLAIRHVLLSPRFLFRVHHVDPTWADYEYAARLGAFLWSGPPDDELLDLVAGGGLATAEGRVAVARSMLDDPRAQSLIPGFADRWLGVGSLASAAPDPELHPTFNEDVRAAMIEEARGLFRDFLDNGMPVDRLLDPGFGFLDDELAAHYGLPPVGRDEVTRVPLGPRQRQGIASLGAWLVANSESDHASPIRRGQWVSDNLLCTPVPPPPPGLGIPELSGDPGASIVERLERHRSDPGCASCHALLDVVGIGFESFDASGAPRAGPLDVPGELPSGEVFEGARQFAEVVDREAFVACVRRKLFTYAAGRAPDPVDEAWLDTLASSGVTLRDLILEVATSPRLYLREAR